ncbi:hypothetical protein [Rubinisphaera margarita]|uniref:hypothetical protein n=1 Tax=Rubinisphaera margarita TaxID=2909586 RepID=UPI001EE85152|nr:hypothetical protein [Rubinisphaera margarita]MCG6155044.1 hypothetical protein [Rubinisphaera margarita]
MSTVAAPNKRYLIGLDEAGYGPKLGPLVIGATLWSVPARLPVDSLWEKLEQVLTNRPSRDDSRLHVGDSKEVYSSSRGLAALERSVMSLFHALDVPVQNPTDRLGFAGLVSTLLGGSLPHAFDRQPWYQCEDFGLPLAADESEISLASSTVRRGFTQSRVRLEAVRVRVVCPEVFNELTVKYGNKSEVLTRETLALLQNIWPDDAAKVEVMADKHGGRNRYLPYLTEAFPDHFFMTEAESQKLSRYRCQNISLSFSVNSERYLPVAVASMMAKYVRELCMEQFNRYWSEHCPAVRATRGYPVDASRFRNEIEETWRSMNLPEAILWRER